MSLRSDCRMRAHELVEPFGALSDGDVARLHDLKDLLDSSAYPSLPPIEAAADIRQLPALAYKYRTASPFNTLVRLFALGLDIDAAELADVVDGRCVDTCSGLGLLERNTDGGWRSTAKLFPFKGGIVVCDFHHRRDPSVERVYSPGADSMWLVNAGIRLPFDNALDLCTGSGIQAVMAAQHAASVIAVDLNPRAVRFARLSLGLNRADHARVRLGDLYEAVPGESFDFITANPPFVISRMKTHLYRDGGTRGADTLRRVLDGLPRHLRDGGYAQIVTFLHEFEGHSQMEDVRTFAEAHRMETLVFKSDPWDPYQLATSQLQFGITNYASYQTKVREYLEHLDHIKLRSYVSAVITFRNRGTYAFKTKPGLQRVVTFDTDEQPHLRRFYGWA